MHNFTRWWNGCFVVVLVVPRPVQRALESDDELDTLADPCGNSEIRDDVTARFPLRPAITASSPSTTTTSATTTTEFTYYWQNRNYGPSPGPWYPWGGLPTTRLDARPRRPVLPVPSTTPRQLNGLLHGRRIVRGDTLWGPAVRGKWNKWWKHRRRIWTVKSYSPGGANVHPWTHLTRHPKRHLDRFSRLQLTAGSSYS